MGIAKLLKPKEAAEYLQVSEKTLEDWRRNNSGPTFQRMNRRCVRYFQSDIDRWLKEQTAQLSTNNAPPDKRLLIEVAHAD
jgi:predicted DNA-binding transcriptional regulator AlpA